MSGSRLCVVGGSEWIVHHPGHTFMPVIPSFGTSATVERKLPNRSFTLAKARRVSVARPHLLRKSICLSSVIYFSEVNVLCILFLFYLRMKRPIKFINHKYNMRNNNQQVHLFDKVYSSFKIWAIRSSMDASGAGDFVFGKMLSFDARWSSLRI